jgi:hypothetical protein
MRLDYYSRQNFRGELGLSVGTFIAWGFPLLGHSLDLKEIHCTRPPPAIGGPPRFFMPGPVFFPMYSWAIFV